MDDRRSNQDEFAGDDLAIEAQPSYAGMRMTADEYEKLPDDGLRYELIDGVVVMAPSPDFDHQSVAIEVERQIAAFLIKRQIGRISHEMDVNFGRLHVYRPDFIYLSRERWPKRSARVRVAPDMILEVLSPGTRGRDLETKRQDYERFGVTEYWIFDPRKEKFTFLRIGDSGYEDVTPKGNRFNSKAIVGFTLDIAAVRRVLRD